MQLNVFNKNGEDTGRMVTLNDTVFGIEPNDHAIYLDVKQHMANKRQGTHKAKERSEITGSTRKLIRQKGSGGARKGDVKSPVMVGGGRIFGPKPRDYSFKLNKKVKALARKSALTYKALENAITIVEDFTWDVPKTKDFLSFINVLNLNGRKTLFVLPENNKSIFLSARNLQTAKVVTVTELNTYKVLDANNILFTERALSVIQDNLHPDALSDMEEDNLQTDVQVDMEEDNLQTDVQADMEDNLKSEGEN